jgi:hypothetical protein
MIRPGFLPVGMSTSNRIIKPGYETYQQVIAARQFGSGQVPPHFHINHLVESRADLPNGLTSSRCYSMFDNLQIPIPADLSFTSSSIGFNTWWEMWRTHVFRRALGPLLPQIDLEYAIPKEEVLNPCFYSSKSSIPFSWLILTHFAYSNKMVQNLQPMMGNHYTFFQLLLMSSFARDLHQ